MLEVFIAIVVVIGFFIFAATVIGVLFKLEIEELKQKDRRYYYKQYLYHTKEAKRAYKKYQSLSRDGGDSIKSRRRNYE